VIRAVVARTLAVLLVAAAWSPRPVRADAVVGKGTAVEHPCEECMEEEAAFRLGRGEELCVGCVMEVPEEAVHWVSIAFQKRRH
jgi:hypothetical protein